MPTDSALIWAAASRRTLATVKARPDLGVPADVVDAFEEYLDDWEPKMRDDVFEWSGEIDPDLLRHLAAHWARIANMARDDSETALAPADPGGQEFYDALVVGFAVALSAADDAERFAPKFEEVVPDFAGGRPFDGPIEADDLGVVRVLLVDDNADIRLLVRIGLEHNAGIEIVGEACDGQEALDALGGPTGCPDVMLLDLTMPVMDGLTALPLIRERCPSTRVVVFSANDSGANRSTALALGASDFLRKDAGIGIIAETLLGV